MVAAGVVVAVVGGGYAAYAAQADAPSYRTATATIGDVEETLGLSGTVEPAGRADLSFATSGTVASVSVEEGETVRAGQVLARLDAADLRRAVTQARSTLATARAQLEADREGQASAVEQVTGSEPTADTVAYRTVSTEEPEPDPDDPLAGLAALQQAVIDAQSVVSDSLVVASDALAAQQAACTPETVGEQVCADALAAVQAAQQQVSDDQATLQAALDALASFLQEVAEQPTQEPEQPTEQPSPQQPELPEQQPPGQVEQPTQPETSGESTTASAATLAQDQAEIDQAEADLVAAQQELAMATVTAPFGGRVVSVDTTKGASVSSGTAVIVLVSQGTTTVQVTATSTQVRSLELGQQATATAVGSTKELTGTVTQISSQPDEDGAYPVTITLDRKKLDLATGLTAAVSVVTGTAEDVVTVPASAVSDGVVQVVAEGAASRVPVTTGATGETTVEITDGLEAGDVVVLADLDRALPTSDTTGENGFPGGGEVRFPGPITVERSS